MQALALRDVLDNLDLGAHGTAQKHTDTDGSVAVASDPRLGVSQLIGPGCSVWSNGSKVETAGLLGFRTARKAIAVTPSASAMLADFSWVSPGNHGNEFEIIR